MDDDGLGIIGGLIVFFFAIIAAIFIIYILVVFVLPPVLYGLAVYHSGRHLRMQVTQRYTLTPKSRAVLAGVGLVVLIFSLLLTSALGLHPFISILIFVPLFLGAAIFTLWAWGYAKRRDYLVQLQRLRAEEDGYLRQLRANEAELERLEGQIQEIERRSGEPLQEVRQLEGLVSELCQHDPRVLSLRKRHWQGEFSKLDHKELWARERAALALLRRRSTGSEEKLLPSLQASLLRLERLKRGIGKPVEALQQHQETARQLRQENERIAQRLTEIRRARAHKESTYQAFAAQRIALD